jgi:hypothetical protein
VLQYGEGSKIEIFCFQICQNVRKGEMIKACNVFDGKPERKRLFGSSRRRRIDVA